MTNLTQYFDRIGSSLKAKVQPAISEFEILLWKSIVAFLAWKPGIILPGTLLLFGISLVILPTGYILFRLNQPETGKASFEAIPEHAVLSESRISGSGQKNLLLILVDRFDQLQPAIDGVWLVVNGSLRNGSNFLPVEIVSESGGVNSSAASRQEALISSQGAPTQKLIDELISRGLWWDYYLVVDRVGLAGLIGWTGRFTANETWMNSNQAVLEQNSNPNKRDLVQQAAYLRALCERSELINRNLAPETILSLLAGHFQTDYDLTHLSEDWYSFRGRGFAWYCDFPTLKESSFNGQSQ
jgi:hypothetical protein